MDKQELAKQQKLLKEKEKEAKKERKEKLKAMTPEERSHPEILRNSRKLRIASGSGTTSADINRLLNQFEEMKKMMKQMPQMMKSGKFPNMK